MSLFTEENSLAAGTVKNRWIIDSGATPHMCNNVANFTNIKPLGTPIRISVGDGRVIECRGIGTVELLLKTVHDINITRCNVQEVLRVPELEYSLLSVSELRERGKVCHASEGV